MAKFKAGQSGNPSGRPRGAVNKLNRTIKELMHDFLTEKIQELPALWEKLSPRDKVNFIKDIMPYYKAKIQAISINDLDFECLSDEQLDMIINKLKASYENKEDNRDQGSVAE